MHDDRNLRAIQTERAKAHPARRGYLAQTEISAGTTQFTAGFWGGTELTNDCLWRWGRGEPRFDRAVVGAVFVFWCRGFPAVMPGLSRASTSYLL